MDLKLNSTKVKILSEIEDFFNLMITWNSVSIGFNNIDVNNKYPIDWIHTQVINCNNIVKYHSTFNVSELYITKNIYSCKFVLTFYVDFFMHAFNLSKKQVKKYNVLAASWVNYVHNGLQEIKSLFKNLKINKDLIIKISNKIVELFNKAFIKYPYLGFKNSKFPDYNKWLYNFFKKCDAVTNLNSFIKNNSFNNQINSVLKIYSIKDLNNKQKFLLPEFSRNFDYVLTLNNQENNKTLLIGSKDDEDNQINRWGKLYLIKKFSKKTGFPYILIYLKFFGRFMSWYVDKDTDKLISELKNLKPFGESKYIWPNVMWK